MAGASRDNLVPHSAHGRHSRSVCGLLLRSRFVVVPHAEELRNALRAGRLSDGRFDALYSPAVRRVAERFWTPLAIADRVARLLQDWGVRRVLDAGSGSGKFCIAAAARAPCVRFTGIEHRADLVVEAREVAEYLQVGNVSFIVGDATPWRPDAFDAVYFFNPFAENLCRSPAEQYDSNVELSRSRFVTDVRATEACLEHAASNFLLVTYYGYGGCIPGNYELIHSEGTGTDWLRAWRKRDAGGAAGRWYVDHGENVWLVEARGRRPYTKLVVEPRAEPSE